MIVTYLKENEQVVSIIEGFPKVWEDNNELVIENGSHPVLNDLTKAAWGYYEDKQIERQYDENDIELPLYLKDLGLVAVTQPPQTIEARLHTLEQKVSALEKR